jgi:23S rRNA (cytosine1962-C5)-methyltransferase
MFLSIKLQNLFIPSINKNLKYRLNLDFPLPLKSEKKVEIELSKKKLNREITEKNKQAFNRNNEEKDMIHFRTFIPKNYQKIKYLMSRKGINSFRIYDNTISYFPLSIDVYGDKVCINYYSKDSSEPSILLKNEVNSILNYIFGSNNVYWKIRTKKGTENRQFNKLGDSNETFVVKENKLSFIVNLQDYMDTGLFLHHRDTRALTSLLVNGRMLNLFSYTCSFSVYAAMKDAQTTNVDLSNTYLDWGVENFILNKINPSDHEFYKMDCLEYLRSCKKEKVYSVIVIDPPTYSRSKGSKKDFDVQKDYIELINLSLELLNDDGYLFFSTNLKTFNFDESKINKPNEIVDVTESTIPLDFQDKTVHKCWAIRHNQKS